MTSMNLVLRPSTKGYGDTGSLTLRLIHDRRVKSIVLAGCRIRGSEWDKTRQEIIYPADNPERQAYLKEIETRIDREMRIIVGFLTVLRKKGYYTVDELVSLYREKKDDGKLLGFAENLSRQLERNGQHRTAAAYRTVVQGIIRYNGGVDIPLRYINACLIKGFERHLRDSGRLPNTVAYYMRNLRAIYNKARSEHRIVNRYGENPFAGISTAVTKTMKRALSMEEIKSLHTIDFVEMSKGLDREGKEYKVIQNLNRTWRYFFFCFYARGMSFIDMAYLRKDNLRGGFIRYCRKKTGQQIEVRITDELKCIIDSFADEVIGLDYVFPVIRDRAKEPRIQYETAMRMQNTRLKKLATLAGINRCLSSHVARHSWASAGKALNLPIEVISECLGHDSPITTLIYTARLENRMLDDANALVASAIRCGNTPMVAALSSDF